jgi:hypothetical protein
MFSNGKSILVQPIQRDDLILNEIDNRLIDIQQKITDLLSAGYAIYDVASATNSNFNNLIASSSGNRVCVWKTAGSTAYTLLSTELASNGTNVIVNAIVNNMNQVTAIRDCKLTCSASSGLFANKAEFYGGDWYLASWTTGSNVKFTDCDVHAYTSEVYLPDVNFEYCNVIFKRSCTIAYSTYKINTDTRFVNETTSGSTVSTLTINTAYTTSSDWFLRCTMVDWQNTGNLTVSSSSNKTFNFTGLKIENSDLVISNLYTTEGSKIYYEGQNLTLSGSITGLAWGQVGTTNISSSSGLYPSLAFNQSGIPYVAFKDNSTGSVGKASCYKYGSTGWQVVGYNAFTSNVMDYINLCISTDNDIVVVGRDNSSKASAYYFNVTASSWNLLGSAGFSTNLVAVVRAAYSLSTCFGIKTIISAVSNTSGDRRFEGYTMDITSFTNSWININANYSTNSTYYPSDFTLGSSYFYQIDGGTILRNGQIELTPGTTITVLNQNIAFNMSTAVTKAYCDKTNNIVAFIDNNSSKCTLYGVGTTQFSTGTAQEVSCARINSVNYVAIQDTTAKASMYKFVVANSSWNLAGSANFSTENVGRIQLASYNNDPYLVVEEKAAPGIALYKFGETLLDSNVNYSFENLETDIYDGEKALDITSIQSSSNYIVQNCKVRPGYNIVDTAVGRFIRNTYNIELAPGWNPTVDDALKETNADTFWIVKREDIEGTLNGMVIKNLKLYDSGLSPYTYNSNDNFIIIANNVSKGNAVFCYYNQKIKGTVFSDWFLDSSYTITDCFILMEVNEISELQNAVPSTMLADGPLEVGSIVFNSYDNEIIV